MIEYDHRTIPVVNQCNVVTHFKSAKFEANSVAINQFDWGSYYAADNINKAISLFSQTMLSIIKKYVPKVSDKRFPYYERFSLKYVVCCIQKGKSTSYFNYRVEESIKPIKLNYRKQCKILSKVRYSNYLERVHFTVTRFICCSSCEI